MTSESSVRNLEQFQRSLDTMTHPETRTMPYTVKERNLDPAERSSKPSATGAPWHQPGGPSSFWEDADVETEVAVVLGSSAQTTTDGMDRSDDTDEPETPRTGSSAQKRQQMKRMSGPFRDIPEHDALGRPAHAWRRTLADRHPLLPGRIRSREVVGSRP